jgi:hypothetical protein
MPLAGSDAGEGRTRGEARKETAMSETTIKSAYGDGTFRNKLPVCRTVGELRDLLATLPADLPTQSTFVEGVQPVWFNVGSDDEHLAIEDPDDPGDENEGGDDDEDAGDE